LLIDTKFIEFIGVSLSWRIHVHNTNYYAEEGRFKKKVVFFLQKLLSRFQAADQIGCPDGFEVPSEQTNHDGDTRLLDKNNSSFQVMHC
jgi:hypothetical protein